MKFQRGFSMVELMVATTLGLLVTGALVAVFSGVRNASGTTTGVAAIADSGRFALDFIQQSVRGAGFMACNSTLRQDSLLAQGPGPSPLLYDFSEPVGGYEAGGTGIGGALTIGAMPVTADPTAGDWTTQSGAIPASLDAALTGSVIKGSDVLVVQGTLTSFQPVVVSTIVDGASSFTVSNATGLGSGQLAVISDCAKSTVFQISGITGGNTVNHATGAGVPDNTQSAFFQSFSPGAQLGLADTTIFYIGVGADGDAALFSRSRQGNAAFQPAQELVSDVENLQVLYGVDNSGTNVVSQYVRADQVSTQGSTTDFNSVISLKVAVLTASAPGAVPVPSAASTFNLLGTTVTAPRDTRMRKVFDMTISLRNTTG